MSGFTGTRKLASGRTVTFKDGVKVADAAALHEDHTFDLEIQAREREEAVRVAEFKMDRDMAGLAGARTTSRSADIAPGTYTIVRADGSYRTLQIAPAAWADGQLAISYLSGPDNELSYTGCAFYKGGTKFNMWKRFKTDSALVRDIDTLMRTNITSAHERFLGQAEAYALKSGQCMRCTRKLTVPASLHRGLGPVCAGIEGV